MTAGAQEAVTRYRTGSLANGDEAALVELSPRTGRMHQLRVHLASLVPHRSPGIRAMAAHSMLARRIARHRV